MHIVTAYKNNRMKFSLIRKDSDRPLLLFCNGDTYKHTFTLWEKEGRKTAGRYKEAGAFVHVSFEGGCYPGQDQCSKISVLKKKKKGINLH